MSWLARSLVNTLRGEEEQQRQQDEDDDPQSYQDPNNNQNQKNEEEEDDDDDEDEDPTRGVKEDLSELTKTLTRQFWGVASFLAPPPPGESSPSDPGQRPDAEADSDGLSGIRSDFAEIGGRFKSGISMLSNAKAVTEISKIASTFLQEISSKEEEEELEENEEGEGSYEGGAVGVTEEVVAFARNVSMHPETWLDFPLIPDEDDSDGLALLYVF